MKPYNLMGGPRRRIIRSMRELDRIAAHEARKASERAARARGVSEFEIRMRCRAMRRFWGAFLLVMIVLAIFIGVKL